MDLEPVGRPVRQRLPQRLQAPVRRGMRGPVGGEHAPRPPFPEPQHVPSAEGDLTHGAEAAGHDRLGVIVEERQPSLLRIWGPPASCISHRQRRNPEAAFPLVGHAFLAQGPLRAGHLADPSAKVLG